MEKLQKTRTFQTIEEIREYLSGEKIKCLICSQEFKWLTPHLKKHNITIRDYKICFGIPLSYRLSKGKKRKSNNPKIGSASRKNRKKQFWSEISRQQIAIKVSKEQLKNAHTATRKAAAKLIEVKCSVCGKTHDKSEHALKTLKGQNRKSVCSSRCKYLKRRYKTGAITKETFEQLKKTPVTPREKKAKLIKVNCSSCGKITHKTKPGLKALKTKNQKPVCSYNCQDQVYRLRKKSKRRKETNQIINQILIKK